MEIGLLTGIINTPKEVRLEMNGEEEPTDYQMCERVKHGFKGMKRLWVSMDRRYFVSHTQFNPSVPN